MGRARKGGKLGDTEEKEEKIGGGPGLRARAEADTGAGAGAELGEGAGLVGVAGWGGDTPTPGAEWNREELNMRAGAGGEEEVTAVRIEYSQMFTII